jgi:hypothetical protein
MNVSGLLSPYHLAFNTLDDATQRRLFAEMGRRGDLDTVRRLNQEALAAIRQRIVERRRKVGAA